jgi:hypothetical protein
VTTSTSVRIDVKSATTATDSDNGHAITIHPGDRLRLVLASAYWTINDPHSAALRLDGPPEYPAATSHCVPGQGCGGVIANFTALQPGTATITASRTSCGEAMRCTPAAGRYSVTIEVR